jgi:hypothetical protein
MSWADALEDFLYGWVRRNAPHVSRDALDVLLDNTSDICRNAAAGAYCGSDTIPSRLDHDEILRGWADLR